MKKRFFVALALVATMLLGAFGLVACGEKEDKPAELKDTYYYHRAAVTGDGAFKHLYYMHFYGVDENIGDKPYVYFAVGENGEFLAFYEVEKKDYAYTDLLKEDATYLPEAGADKKESGTAAYTITLTGLNGEDYGTLGYNGKDKIYADNNAKIAEGDRATYATKIEFYLDANKTYYEETPMASGAASWSHGYEQEVTTTTGGVAVQAWQMKGYSSYTLQINHNKTYTESITGTAVSGNWTKNGNVYTLTPDVLGSTVYTSATFTVAADKKSATYTTTLLAPAEGQDAAVNAELEPPMEAIASFSGQATLMVIGETTLSLELYEDNTYRFYVGGGMMDWGTYTKTGTEYTFTSTQEAPAEGVPMDYRISATPVTTVDGVLSINYIWTDCTLTIDSSLSFVSDNASGSIAFPAEMQMPEIKATNPGLEIVCYSNGTYEIVLNGNFDVFGQQLPVEDYVAEKGTYTLTNGTYSFTASEGGRTFSITTTYEFTTENAVSFNLPVELGGFTVSFTGTVAIQK